MSKDFGKYFKLLHKYSKGYRSQILFALVCGIIANLTLLVLPFVTRFLIDVVIFQRYYSFFKFTLLAIIILLIILFVTSLVANYLFFYSFGRININLQTDVFKNLQFAAMPFYENVPSGEISYRILTDAYVVGKSWMDYLATIPLHLVFLIAIIFMFRWHKELTMFILLILFLQSLIVVKFRKPLLHYSFRIKEKQQEILGYTTEHFSKIQLIRSLCMEKREQSKFSDKLFGLFKTSLQGFMINKLSSVLSLVVNNLWAFGILWYGGLQAIKGNISVGTLVAFLVFTNLLSQPIVILTEAVLSFQDVKASLRRVLTYYEGIIPEVIESEKGNIEMSDSRIVIKELSFSYNENPVLKNINLEILPRSIFALVGPSGAGKSTLCKLLVRFYEPQKGEIFIGNKRIQEIPVSVLRRNVLLVLQNQYVFNGTIFENITCGLENVDEKKVLIAIKNAAIDFIDELPYKLHTKIGVDGTTLSVGQAQRIALARAFFLSPKIFILDEPTAFIDCETEEKIRSSLLLLKQQSTIILIAHRLSTVMMADKVAIMINGEIKEVGEPKTLIKNPHSMFSKMYNVFLGG